MKRYVLIVAGGSGSRMKSSLPKQFIPLNGKPVLMHTIEAFYNFDPKVSFILVIPSGHFGLWEELCQTHSFAIPHKLAAGGETRFHSVKNGLQCIYEEGWVAIHDGVRPLVSLPTIARCFGAAEKTGNAIPCISVNESIRKTTKTSNTPVDRSSLKLIQTPQIFPCSLIKKAFEQEYDPSFTDDASVLEKMGIAIHLVEGNRENIKLTEPVDLLFAEALLKNNLPG